jgi:uncharacterized membrane protein YccC
MAPPPRAFLRPLLAVRPIWALGSASIATTAVLLAFGVVGEAEGARSAVMALAGAMAVLFARGEPYIHRARTVVTIGLLILAFSVAAAVVSAHPWELLAVLTVAAAAAATTTEILRTPVPGPTIILVAVTIVAAVPYQGNSDLRHRAVTIALGSVVALLVTLTPWILRRHAPEERALAKAFQAIASTLRTAGASGFAGQLTSAWVSLDAAERALAAGAPVPGRNDQRHSQLWALIDHGARLLGQAQTLHADGSTAAQEAIEVIRGIAGQIHPKPHLRRVIQAAAPGNPVDANGDAVLAQAHSARAVLDETRNRLPSSRQPRKIVPLLRVRAVLSRNGMAYPTRLALITLVSGAVAIGFGLDRWYWTPVCAVATIWGSDTWVTWHRGVQRAAATVAGCVIGIGLLQLNLGFAEGIAIVGLLFFAGELLFPRNYGFAMTPITAMIIVIVQLASPAAVNGWSLAADRVTAAALGSALGLVAVLFLWPRSATSRLAQNLESLEELETEISGRLALADVSDAVRESLRRQLIGSLIEVERSAHVAAGEFRARSAMRGLFTAVASVSVRGYQLIAQLDDEVAAVGAPD